MIAASKLQGLSLSPRMVWVPRSKAFSSLQVWYESWDQSKSNQIKAKAKQGKGTQRQSKGKAKQRKAKQSKAKAKQGKGNHKYIQKGRRASTTRGSLHSLRLSSPGSQATHPPPGMVWVSHTLATGLRAQSLNQV